MMEEVDRSDFISELPDEIRVKIIGMLPLKEAARTSILSKKWIDLWRYVANLDIDFKSILKRHSWYVNCMNDICNLHKSSTIDEFRVCLNSIVYTDCPDLNDKVFRDHIERWLDFALSRRVKKLEFDLNYTGMSGNGEGSYPLSKDTFDRIIGRRGLSSIGFLTSLSLKCVDVSSEVLERLLSCCALLERLIVDKSPGLVKFRVAGFQLKELSITSCFSLRELEIDAANLVSFTLHARKTTLHLQNVPCLVSLSFDLWSHLNSIFATSKHQSGCFSQLQNLELVATQEQLNVSELPQFSRLQNLVLFVYAKSDASLLSLTSIINASPSLKKLVLSLNWRWRGDSSECKKMELPHQSLKVVQIAGYEGNNADGEFAEFILSHAVVLQRIIFDVRTQRARENALELKPLAPPSLDFIVLLNAFISRATYKNTPI